MSAFTKLGDYANGTVADGDELTTEFNNIYNAFNGTSSDKEIHHKFSGANPAAILEQLSTGDILRLLASGVIRWRVAADGSIRDANGNELLDFSAVASAINYLRILNAATGQGPSISAVGDDTNINLNLIPKGSGLVNVQGSQQIAGTLLINSANPALVFDDTAGIDGKIDFDASVLRFGTVLANQFTLDLNTGVVSFTQIPEGPNSNPTTDNQLTRKAYVDGAIATAVPQAIGTGNSPTFAGLTVSGNETVGGNLDVNGQINIGSGNGAIKNITQGTVNVDPPASPGGDASVDITISGVSPGDIVTFIPDPALESTDERRCVGSYVIAADTVRLTIQRFTVGSSNNPGARAWQYIWFDLT